MVGRLFLGIALLFLSGCALSPPPPGGATPSVVHLHNTQIATDTTWSGSIVITGEVKVFKGATLSIAPGTEIAFVRRDADRDGLGDGTLIVEGRLLAIGTSRLPIRFRSAEKDPQPGDWLELRVDFSRETLLRHCEIRDSAHALHAHFTRAIVEDCRIHHNIDGSRLGQGTFVYRRNLIENNEGKGLNFRNATIEIVDNIIRRNGAGIFLFETDREPTIVHNNLYANGDNLRLGDFFHRDLTIGENWWGSADPALVAASIYDAAEDSTLGRVNVAIAPAWHDGCGPKDPLRLLATGAVATDGYVDAAPQPVGNDLLVASWDGTLRRIDRQGKLFWRTPFAEVIDAPPLVDGERIFGQHWGREVFCLDARSGTRRWSFTYEPSPADDHRQGGLLRVGELLLVPAWNGTLYALDPQSGRERWRFAGRAPLRAAPVLDGERIFLSGGDGTLWCLDLQGRLLWERSGAAPLLTPVARTARGVVALDRDGGLFAFDRDGGLLWKRALGETCYYAAPLAHDEGLFVATAAGALWKLDPETGMTIWRKSGFGPIYATPLAAGNRLLIGDNHGALQAIAAISGNTLARLDFGAAIQGGPTAIVGGFAFGSRDQHLHFVAIEATDDRP